MSLPDIFHKKPATFTIVLMKLFSTESVLEFEAGSMEMVGVVKILFQLSLIVLVLKLHNWLLY